MSQFGKIAKPCIVEILVWRFFFLAGLRIIPVKISSLHIIFRISANATHITTRNAHEHPVGREERHLGVVANQSLSLVVEVELCDSSVAILCKNAVAAHKFHRIA